MGSKNCEKKSIYSGTRSLPVRHVQFDLFGIKESKLVQLFSTGEANTLCLKYTTYCGVPDPHCLSKMSFILPDMLEIVA